jgi:hypothetical protein
VVGGIGSPSTQAIPIDHRTPRTPGLKMSGSDAAAVSAGEPLKEHPSRRPDTPAGATRGGTAAILGARIAGDERRGLRNCSFPEMQERGDGRYGLVLLLQSSTDRRAARRLLSLTDAERDRASWLGHRCLMNVKSAKQQLRPSFHGRPLLACDRTPAPPYQSVRGPGESGAVLRLRIIVWNTSTRRPCWTSFGARDS